MYKTCKMSVISIRYKCMMLWVETVSLHEDKAFTGEEQDLSCTTWLHHIAKRLWTPSRHTYRANTKVLNRLWVHLKPRFVLVFIRSTLSWRSSNSFGFTAFRRCSYPEWLIHISVLYDWSVEGLRALFKLTSNELCFYHCRRWIRKLFSSHSDSIFNTLG